VQTNAPAEHDDLHGSGPARPVAGTRGRRDRREYALMVAIIALLMVAGFYFLFQNVSTAFDDTASCIAGPGGSADCPTPSSGS
jgi:Flp pilus assembly pilin Flp